MKRIAILMAALALTGCGTLGPLKPPKGEALPVKPAMAQTTPTAEELLSARADAHPERVDEILKKSVPRRADRFDLPPPDGGAAPLPDTAPPTSSETPTVVPPK